jgi:predicted component of type VI protein secretion system
MCEGYRADYRENVAVQLRLCGEATAEQMLKLTFEDVGDFSMHSTSNQPLL